MSTHALTKKRPNIFKQFNWRAILVRILVNALTLILTAFLIPSIGFVAPLAIWKILLVAVALGLINALIKPIIQFLTLSYIFATYGLVVIFINTIVLYLLSWFLPGYFHVGNFLWALLGGAMMGIIAGFLESLFGLTLPIVDEKSVSEPMRNATDFDRRKKQVFPFSEVSETEKIVEDLEHPTLPLPDDAVIAVPSTGPERVPVPAAPQTKESLAETSSEVVDEPVEIADASLAETPNVQVEEPVTESAASVKADSIPDATPAPDNDAAAAAAEAASDAVEESSAMEKNETDLGQGGAQ